MTKQVQLRRGTTAEHAVFTGALAELTVNTDKKVAVVHDGITIGGNELVGVAATSQTIVNKDGLAIGTSIASSPLTVVGDSIISGVGTFGSDLFVDGKAGFLRLDNQPKVKIGFGDTEFFVEGSAKITESLNTELVISNEINISGYGVTTFSANTLTRGNISIGSTIISLVDTDFINENDFITIPSTDETFTVIGFTTTTVDVEFNETILESTTKIQVSSGSTVIIINDDISLVSVGNSLTIDGFFENVPIEEIGFGLSGIEDEIVATTQLVSPALASDNIVSVASSVNISVGNSFSTADFNSETFELVLDGLVTNLQIIAILESFDDEEIAIIDVEESVSIGGTIFVLEDVTLIQVGDILLIDNTFELVISAVNTSTDTVTTETGSPVEVQQFDQVTIIRRTVGAGFPRLALESPLGVDLELGKDIVITNPQLVFDDAIIISSGNAVSEPIPAGTPVIISEVTSTSSAVLIDGQTSDNIDDSSLVEIVRIRDAQSSVKLNSVESEFLNSTGISTLSGLTYPTEDGFIGNPLVTDGDGNISVSNSLEVEFLNSVGISTLSGLTYPFADGKKGQVLVTDGDGILGFTTNSGGAGGRFSVRVSSTNGDDANDGRTLPVQTIKRATQIASLVGEPATIFVESGEYIEENPLILYDEISVIGDSLRNVVIRPKNAGKDILRVRNGCYITGMTFNDFVDGITKVPQHTWSYSMAFDDPYDVLTDRTGYACTGILNVTNALYDGVSGLTTITTEIPHELYRGTTARVIGIGWTCGYDETGISTFVYNNQTGISTITLREEPSVLNVSGDKGYEIGGELFLHNLPFACTEEHTGVTTTIFPYEGLDATYGSVYDIIGINTSEKTITIQGGISTIPHIYVGWTPIGISTFEYTETTGVSTVVTVQPHEFQVNDNITLIDLPFSCSSEHIGVTTTLFPDGSGEYKFTFKVSEVIDDTTFVFTAGISTIAHIYEGFGEVGISTFEYTHTTGISTAVTTSSHGLVEGDYVTLDGLVFSCLPGSIGDEIGVSTASYDNVTGITTITTDINHGYSVGNRLRIENLVFECDSGGGLSTALYPSGNLGYEFTILEVNSSDSFVVNVGVSTIEHYYVEGGTVARLYTPTIGITTAEYDNISGVTTITASGLFVLPGDTIRLDNLVFECDSGNGISTGLFPSADGITLDPDYPREFQVIDVLDNNIETFTFTVNVGVSTIVHTYIDGGTVTSGITTTIFPDGTGNPVKTFRVIGVSDSTTFTCETGPSPMQHFYESGGTAKKVPITKKVPTIQRVWRYPDRHKSGKIDFGVVAALSPTEFIIRGETIEGIPHFYTKGGTIRLTKPKINKSPYIQNCSILSSLGGNGILVDGDKIIDTNRALIPELGELPASGPQPEFGKSMVAATFTMISFGGIGWRTINDGYAQVVSCFQIFCRYGSLCQSGGYLSITNSATNFGDFALRSTGFSRNSFEFDRGRVVDTGFQDGLQTLKVIGLGRSDQQLYVLRFFNNDNNDETSIFKPLVVEQEFESSAVNVGTNQFTIPGHPFQNSDSIIYLGNELAVPPQVIVGLVNNGVYYVEFVDASNFKIYLDEGFNVPAIAESTFVGINTFTKNNQEFFVNEIIDQHTIYQEITFDENGPTPVFVSGREVIQTVSGGNAVGFALTYRADVNKLIVSTERIGGVRNLFRSDGSDILDHSDTPVAIGVVDVVGISTYHTINFRVDSTITGNVVTGISNLPETYKCHFHRPSIINSSAHTWEYSGSGSDYNALPQNGGKGRPETEQVGEVGGRVYASGTNELGDFKIGTQIIAFNRTGNIIFNNKVSIGELDSIRLSLSGGVAVEEFSTDVQLGEFEIGGPQNKRVSTQLAVRSFLSNRLGSFIDKNVSTNAIPNAVVQLNASGQINPDLIPPKVVSFITTPVEDLGRTVLVNKIPAVNILQGDTVVQPDNSYVLVNDTISEYLILDNGDTVYSFENDDSVISALTSSVTGIVTAPPQGIGIGTTVVSYTGYGTTGLVSGVGLFLEITNSGSGYLTPGFYEGIPSSTVTGEGQNALLNIEVGPGGTVTSVNFLAGGKNYEKDDILTISNANLIGGRSGGSDFQVKVTNNEIRLYLKLTSNQKFPGSAALADFIEDRNAIGISTNLQQDYNVTFTPTDVVEGGDINFVNSTLIIGPNEFSDGDPIIYDTQGGNMISASGVGIFNLDTYYIKLVGAGTSVELHRGYLLNNKITFTGSGGGSHALRRRTVNVLRDTLVFVNHPYTTGSPVRANGSTPIGISTGEFYYCGSVTQNSFTLHTTQADATASVNGVTFNQVSIGSTSSGTFDLVEQNVRYQKTVNTSSSNPSNWTLLASGVVTAENIISGIISPDRLGVGVANESTVLTGSSEYVKNVFAIGIGNTQPMSAISSSTEFPNDGIGITTHYGKVNLILDRVIPTLDLFSTLGVSRFRSSTFEITEDGSVSIKNSVSGDVDSATLGGFGGAYYLDSANHTGAIPLSRGGTGLTGIPAIGAILIGNGSAYNLTTTPIFVDDVTISPPGRLFFGSGTRQMINLWSASYGLGVQSSTLYFRSASRFSWFRGGSHNNNENNPGTGGISVMTLDNQNNLTVAGKVTANSDAKLKKNISTITNALDKTLKLRGVEYDRIDTNDHQIGVIAQEIESVIPEVVVDGIDGIKSVAYGNIIALLIESIKEQNDIINKLQQEVKILQKIIESN